MYRLMIADDEDDERRGIQFLLRRSGFSFEITEAVNGMEALDILKNNPADILFTDVKMPFLDGIELATEAKKLYPNIQIIFFSGYDDFEYVKRALSLQAVDYILKPVNPSELERIISLVLERMERGAEEAGHKHRFYKNYVVSRLLNQVPYQTLNQEYEEESLRFLSDYKRLILMEFEEDFFGNEAVEMKKFFHHFKDVIPYDYDFLDITPSQGVFFLKEGCPDESYGRELGRLLHLEIEKVYGKRCYLAISPQIEGPEDIGKAYENAEECLEERFFYRDVYIYPLDKRKQKEARPAFNDSQLLVEIEKDVSCRDICRVRKDMSVLLEQCRNNGYQSYIYVRFICSNILKVLYEDMPGGGQSLSAMVEKIYSCGSFDELEAILWTAADDLEAQVKPEEDPSKHTIALVEQYIKANYKEGLSLDILAEKVYLTPHYLSSIFIQEKGIGINKYIKNVRMEKARELLLGTNMKISDISEQVGYANLSYFCRSFRNEYGMTPDQYRK
ncbi:MAG: response regulator [Lacrimispora sp.]|uniref:response regulator transcription factor n=1 Tax=Lacrimispora sp. TaxID=2719234 RepID=UPI0039E64EBD